MLLQLIHNLQSSLPLPLLSYGCPLLITGCFLLSFRHWLHAKWYAALCIYTLSVFTFAVTKTVTGQSELAAVVGGILAPALYGLLFAGFGALRVLRNPYGLLQAAPRQSSRRTSQIMRLFKSTVGGCVGGITGSTLGGLFSMWLLLIAPLFSVGGHVSLRMLQSVHGLVDGSVILFGSVGVSLGALTGWGCFSLRHVGDRVLIHLVIQSYIMREIMRRILKS